MLYIYIYIYIYIHIIHYYHYHYGYSDQLEDDRPGLRPAGRENYEGEFPCRGKGKSLVEGNPLLREIP